MSDRQVLAEFGTGLCLAGLAPWAAPLLVPVAVLGAFLLDLRGKCDKRLVQMAIDRALKDLTDTPDLTDTDLRTASAWLKHRKTSLRLDPTALAAAAGTGNLPGALYDLIVDDTLARDGGARRAVRLALTSAYQVCRTHPDYHAIFSQQVLIGLARDHGLMLEKLDSIKEDTIALRAQMAQMAQTQALLLANLQASKPQAYANHGPMIIGLAERYARNPDGTPITDFDSAYRGLENALQVAEAMRAQNALPRNAADQIDAVLARVEALNAHAAFDAAEAALAAARAEARDRIAEQTSGLMRLLDTTVAQATLRNRPDQAAEALVERLSLDAPVQHFDALRALWNEWYERGRDKGLAFDLEVAIALAHRSIAVAATADQRGAALNDLGNALRNLGEREPGTARLEAAVAAYAEALKEYTRDRVPLDWATTQNNLGNALSTLGAREPGTARLEEAVAAYAEALKEYTRDRVPLDWATTQNNLGNALSTLGAREPGTARLEEAVAAYAEALKEHTRDRVPLDWAMTQNNLGNALRNLGEREPGTARLEDAVAAYAEALKEYTRDRVPLDWAMTQNNLGNALRTLGAREPGTARLEEAVAAYTEALKEHTRDRVPLDWAMTQNNLGNVLQTLGAREPGTARLEEAVAAYTEALKEHTRDRVPLDWAMTQNNLGTALTTLGAREPGTARLEEAVAAYAEALKERTRDRVPLNWAATQNNLGGVRIAFFDKIGDPTHLAVARAHVEAAREVFVAAGAGHYVGMAEGQLAQIARREGDAR